ncbi:GAF and ANTAR domain-containing protein [Mobilicoccus pelagius]|uniref:ANTAR domain-containing protein n=1 Tax=Mobilicoccus pelagius NBRC 104925 TaxID=1089455 RepID=H5UMJ1_9MICO|nr:GAF and ANTAR domain-containing protein [Mobilicoccus pelagius]GAB46949.1 hypothetical protein MOPEL_001_00670 [Mobilicoccus pelagius NBRC 104925]
MTEANRLAVEFAELAQRLQGSDTDMTLAEALRAAIAAVDADLGGIMLVRNGRAESAAVSDEIVVRADELQLEAGDGPCLEAIAERERFIIEDTAEDDRWPNWCAGVKELGIRSVLSVRLQTAAGTLGALNLYARGTSHFSENDAVVGTILAAHASVALAADKERVELRSAIDSRHMIGMAQGMLMERFKLDREQAFSVLRRYSQDRNVKLREVAAQLVESRALPQ